MKSGSTASSLGLPPADQLPTADFLRPRPSGRRHDGLDGIVRRINSGNLSDLGVPAMLNCRLASLCRRWAPDLRTFVAQVLEHSGNLDHFLCEPAAADHHFWAHGLLEASIRAAEIAMEPTHDAMLWEPLPSRIPQLQQVCAATAFLFDIGKLFSPQTEMDFDRAGRAELKPWADLTRCWRSEWNRLVESGPEGNPALAGWLHQLACDAPAPIRAVRSSRELVRYAVISSWADGDHGVGNGY